MPSDPIRVVDWEDTVGLRFLGSDGIVYSFKMADGKPRISSMPYAYDIAEGNVANHTPWSKIGYTPTMNTTESDLWSAAGVYVFPVTAQQLEVVSSDNTQDIGTVIKGDATGNTVISDDGGTTTTLVDASVDFTTATAVAVGDCLILDPHGATPEYGYVTAVAAHTLTCSNGFSHSGVGSLRYYAVIDKSAYTGAQAVEIKCLDGNYTEISEIIVANGTTEVDTVGTGFFRINAFRIIATGTGNKPTGNFSLRNTAGTVTYSYITAGFTRARNVMYTVPANINLFVTSLIFGFGYAANQTHYCRIYTRANIDPTTKFNTGSLFYPFTEVVLQNSVAMADITLPTLLPPKTDIRVSGVATVAGMANCVLRGWLEPD